MRGEDLALLLADRLSRIVPNGVHVEHDDGELVFWMASELAVGLGGGQVRSCVAEGLEGNRRELGEDQAILLASEAALDHLQDFVDEGTAKPWPGSRTPPTPHAAIRGRRLYLWFGDASEPVLECEPIDLPPAEGGA